MLEGRRGAQARQRPGICRATMVAPICPLLRNGRLSYTEEVQSGTGRPHSKFGVRWPGIALDFLDRNATAV